jgi:DNA-binding transcriptional regulator YhcF (GntR family)
MEFRKQQAIYLQIGDYICDNILNSIWTRGEKIPSVREMAVNVEVNPNTVMRTYADLQQKEIIYNQRGIGFLVADGAIEKILAIKKSEFLKYDLPRLAKSMALLNMNFDDLKKLYVTHCSKEEGE